MHENGIEEKIYIVKVSHLMKSCKHFLDNDENKFKPVNGKKYKIFKSLKS